MSVIETDDLLALARDIAREAGGMLLDRRPEILRTDTKSTPTDVVTEMDRAAEDLIRTRIRAARPGDGIVGEESGEAAGSGAERVRWVVDPIDGTVNYLYGLPLWTVSIGIEVDARAIIGVVAVPGLSTTYSAAVGGGAWAEAGGQRREIHASGARDLATSLIATGFPYAAEGRARHGAAVATMLPQVRDIRRSGAASLDLCWVADGRVDAYLERGLHVWDACAGSVICREAGAVVDRLDGGDLGADDLPEALVVASAPGIAGQIRDLARAVGLG